MGILTADMQRIVREQRLGYVATVCPDGTPNLSPKGTVRVWDDEHLVFADLRSPGTTANLMHSPNVEINVVDPTARRGYRFKGTAEVLTEGDRFSEIRAVYAFTLDGSRSDTWERLNAAVLMHVTRAAPVFSPAYDSGLSEAAIVSQWDAYWDDLRARRAASQPRS